MTYSVKEIFYTLQGEGANAGRPAVFCRFAGCNLWTGREDDRADAVCKFCDTDFVGTDGEGGGKFRTADLLADEIAMHWGDTPSHRFVVLTGGEPLLQVDQALTDALHARGFTIAVETNGTVAPPPGLDWICVSPKADSTLVLLTGDELKLVFPQDGVDPQRFTNLTFTHFFLQPMDNVLQQTNQRLAMQYCLAHPQWKLGLQTHKILAIR
jgi:7-carboxy-7-deazaguanine synthase (Cx14CxxC type)